MTDSETTDALDRKQRQNREERLAEIERWVAYIKDNPPEVWGEQLNTLIESQLESARESGLPAEHYERVEDAGQQLTERADE